MEDIFALFDDSLNTNKKSILLTQPNQEIKTHKLKDIPYCLKKIDDLKANSQYVAGYLSYECTYSFLETASDKKYTAPLICFYSFDQSAELSDQEVELFLKSKITTPLPTVLTEFSLDESFGTYKEKLTLLKDYLRQGESYQVNYTMNSHFGFTGDIYNLYLQLRKHQPVEYGAFLHFPEHKILSFSPELFFKKSDKKLSSKPMKGTMARSADSETDKKIIQQMKQDDKIISENLMIVDMIRNDLSKISQPGSVKAEELFTVETYKTIHQMTSTITSEIPKELNFSTIMKNLFPCASITGAPKKRTTEIIQELENRDRGIYTGAIGFIKPNSDMCFNVPIRTITSQQPGKASMGLGGGILYESSIEGEYQECLDKSLFLQKLNHSLHLIETLIFANNSFKNLNEHLIRLENSANYFSFTCPTVQIKAELENLTPSLGGEMKIKLQLFHNNNYKITAIAIGPEPTKKVVNLSKEPIDSKNIFLQHKTSYRSFYEDQYLKTQEMGLYEALFFNEKNELTEACRHNVFLQINNQLYTPPLSSGLLPGIERQNLIKKGAIEKKLFRQDLENAEKIFLTNSVRGTVEVSLL